MSIARKRKAAAWPDFLAATLTGDGKVAKI